MKHCDLCGLENPDEARFCMKCGKDLDQTTSDVPPGEEETDTFTPSGSHEGPIGASPSRSTSGPPADKESYKQAASRSAVSDAISYHVDEDQQEGPEIQLTDVTADFTERRQFCDKCGASNPYDQSHCHNCGTPLKTRSGQPQHEYAGRAETPLAREPVEPTLLTDMTPSSDYHQGAYDEEGYYGEATGYGGMLAEWGAREWLILIGASVFLAFLIWFLGFGGLRMIFGTKAKNVKKAGQAMVDLGTFEYGLAAVLESSQTGLYSGSGKVQFQSPDSTFWELTLDTPTRGRTTIQAMQVGDIPYLNAATGWIQADPSEADLDFTSFWNDLSNIEDFGNQKIGGIDCYHYKYNVPSLTVTSVLAAGQQTSASDAKVEIWMDTSNFRILKMTAQVFNVQYESARTRVTFDMNLTSTGQPLDIRPPI